MYRLLLLAVAVLPMMGHAAPLTIVTCQVRGDGQVNEFKILTDSQFDQQAWDQGRAAIELVETKNPNGGVKLVAGRDNERLVAAGAVELPNFSFGKRQPKLAQLSLVVTVGIPSTGSKPINQLVYVVDGQAMVKQLECSDARD